ncbi:MAG: hypothetical protein LBH57_03900, partial [Treponema sp.]|nr:hypothetical protein [Treponema sp.]
NSENVSFSKTGGIIYGYDDDPDNPKNNKAEQEGHAVCIFKAPPLFKDTTVGENDILYYYNDPDNGTSSSGWD